MLRWLRDHSQMSLGGNNSFDAQEEAARARRQRDAVPLAERHPAAARVLGPLSVLTVLVLAFGIYARYAIDANLGRLLIAVGCFSAVGINHLRRQSRRGP